MKRLVSIFLALALVAVACGDGEGDETTQATTGATTQATTTATTQATTEATAGTDLVPTLTCITGSSPSMPDAGCSYIVDAGTLTFNDDHDSDAGADIDGDHSSSCAVHPDEVVIVDGLIPDGADLTLILPSDPEFVGYEDAFPGVIGEAFDQLTMRGIELYRVNSGDLASLVAEPGVFPHYHVRFAPKWKYGPYNMAAPAGAPTVSGDRPSSDVRVIVIDSGYAGGVAGVTGTPDPEILTSGQDDAYGHGTFVAGIVNQLVDTPIEVLAAKLGVDREIDELSVHATLTRAGVFDPATNAVVNMSLGTYECSADLIPTILGAIETAQGNVTFVAAAGNDAHTAGQADARFYPASLNGVISVGAARWDGSQWVPSKWTNEADVYAPGEHVVSVHPDYGHAYWSGSSFAAPHIAACVAVGQC